MKQYFNTHFQKELIDIAPGEYKATSSDVLISTVLGSCVSVIIYDRFNRMGGMNHFMLVEGRSATSDLLKKERYGLFAMESLLNEFYRKGSRKEHLQAKMFGGSKVINVPGNAHGLDIGEQNILFARKFLNNEDISLQAMDTGGELPRRIYLFPTTFKVLLKKHKQDSRFFTREDQKAFELYQKKLEEKRNSSKIILF